MRPGASRAFVPSSGTPLLRATFVHLPGVGPSTEEELWREGYRDWSQLRADWPRAGIGRERPDGLVAGLDASEAALAVGDCAWFGRRLPERDHWRLYPSFRERTAFLDIETTSLSPQDGIVTVVTVHGGGRTRTFVVGEDLEELPAYLGRFPVLVTFNGRQFDVPFLAARLPGLHEPPVHIDLRYLFYRLGLSGGLKRIESVLGIGDRSGVEGVNGLEAVRLWREHARGRPGALERLVRYNRADTCNLEPLLEHAVRSLLQRLPLAEPAEPGGPRRGGGSAGSPP
jgi:uncharacterized protein